jgi:hypothetical protein
MIIDTNGFKKAFFVVLYEQWAVYAKHTLLNSNLKLILYKSLKGALKKTKVFIQKILLGK